MSRILRAITHAERPLRRLLLETPLLGTEPRLPEQMVCCPQCGRSAKHAARAISARCPFCAAHLPLEHARITGKSTGRITTLGTVHITKRGAARGSIECGMLIVEGRIDGDAAVHGTAVVEHEAHFAGKLKAHSLTIQMGAEFSGAIDISRPAYETAPIDPAIEHAIEPISPEPIVKRRRNIHSRLQEAAVETSIGTTKTQLNTATLNENQRSVG